MFEHVGRKYYQKFFNQVAKLLNEDGAALIHTIGSVNSPRDPQPWINKYIFPGGYTPSLSEVASPIENSGLIITDLEVLRMHYAHTLRHWKERFLAKKELFKFPINIFLKFYGAFPLNRGKVDLAAFQWAKSQLSTNNKSVLIFPEGTRSKDHIIKRGYNGATLLAIDTNSVLLPLGIYGTETITNYLQFLFPKKRVTVNIGKPFKIMNVPEKKNKETYDLITIEIMERISNLLPDKYKSKRRKILEN